jgi:serine/threonine protein kinase
MVSLDELRSIVGELGLCTAEELSAAPDVDAANWLDSLAQAGSITPFQQSMILSGNGRRLRIGDYRLESRIGAGGMGEVFLGYQPSMDRQVAIKVLDSRLMSEPELVQRFEREVKLTGKLLHAHVVTAFDAGHDDDRYFLVMEYVDGASLDIIARGAGPMSVADALCCGIQAAQGLAYAHANGIVHRDVKPGNLLLSRQGVIKVLDLGLARFREAAAELQTDAATNLSHSGHMLGTVDYLSPEQALDPRQADERSDIYSLGCTLCRLLTGSPPYPQGSMMQRILAHREAPVPSLKQRNSELPDAVAAIVERMIAKRPEDRYATMNEVAEALRQAAPEPLPLDLRPAATAHIDSVRRPADPTAETVVKSMAETSSRAGLPAAGGPATTRLAVPPGDKSSRSVRNRWIAAAAGVVGVGLIVMATIILRWEVEGGTVLLEVHEPNALVLIDGQQRLIVEDAGKIYRVTADPGTRRVSVRLPDGTEIFGEDIEVQSGQDTPVFEVEFEAPDPPDPSNDATAQISPDSDTEATPQFIGEPGVLTVSQTGLAQFKSIRDALSQVKSGETIRVMDAATYSESVMVRGPQFDGITLEAVNGAVLKTPILEEIVAVHDVRDFTLRGFHLHIDASPTARQWCCQVWGRSPGCVLEDLEFLGDGNTLHTGIGIEELDVQLGEKPVVVRNCEFHSFFTGLGVAGRLDAYEPVLSRGILVADNRFFNTIQPVRLTGLVRDMAIVGNTIDTAQLSGVQIQHAVEETSNVLIANNTFIRCESSIRLWESTPIGREIALVNNLALQRSDSDWNFLVAEDNDTATGYGDGSTVLDVYHLGQNWREDDPESQHADGWIPPSDTDVRQSTIEVLSRDANSPDYLRPAAHSPLATAGAGYGALPAYVGAVPPEGVAAWDWSRLFSTVVADAGEADANGNMFTVGAGVVTVSQSDRAQFSSIGDAIKHVQPRETIRVLDDGVYNESLTIQGPKYDGVTLEAVNGAMIEYPAGGRTITIYNTPRFTLRGFHLRAASSHSVPTWCCLVAGRSEGCVFEDLHVTGMPDRIHCGFSFEQLNVDHGESPLIVRKCRIENINVGLRFGGREADSSLSETGGVLIADNEFVDNSQCVRIEGFARDVAVVGNVFLNSSMSGVDIDHACDETAGLLCANNTFLDCATSVRLWETAPIGRDIEFINNLTLGHSQWDWFFYEAEWGVLTADSGDGAAVLDVYRLANNWREFDPETESLTGRIPPAESDVQREEIEMLSRDAASPDFLRPPADSPLATAGVGYGALPAYVGAVPPEGMEPWNWDSVYAETGSDADRLFDIEAGVVTVSQSGQSQLETIGDALSHVQPGETIRVLDDAVYDESLVVQGSKYQDVTLEGVGGATLGDSRGNRILLISNVPGFTLRGFKLAATMSSTPVAWCCVATGNCAGTVLEQLQLEGSNGRIQIGISLEDFEVPDGAEPLVIRQCRFETLGNAVRFGGLNAQFAPVLVRGALLADCEFIDAIQAVQLEGYVQDITVAGNRFVGAVTCGIQMQQIHEDGRNLLIANNSFTNCQSTLRVWETTPQGSDIRFVNNLSLDPVVLDWLIVEAVDGSTIKGPGDGAALLSLYQFSHNWREDESDDLHEAGWIPPSETDVRQATIDLLSRDAKSPDFLRPPADSPLATAGIGGEELPGYVGAVPPEGVDPWTWTLNVDSHEPAEE